MRMQDVIKEGAAHTYHCKDCGCEMHHCKPDCNCEHDSHDESGSWWRDENGNGVPDIMESKDTHCSDKCCGADTKAEDCTCPPTCKHCNCNAVSERARMHAEAMKEDATAGATSAGSIASVSSVPGAKRKVSKKGKYGAPKAPQATNADGTAKNAQDMNSNLMGGVAARR